MRTAPVLIAVCFFMMACKKADTGPVDPDPIVPLPKNVRIYPSSTTQQFETSIATHPSNPGVVLVVACTQDTPPPFCRTGWYYSNNGAFNWSGGNNLPTHSDLGIIMADPIACIDLDGNLFVSGFYGSDVFVARSATGGAGWTQTTVATTSGREKPHMTIDRNSNSPYKNNVYAAYTDLNLIPSSVMFSRSTDRGQTFSGPVSISGTIGATAAVGVNLSAGPDSALYATFSGSDSPTSSFIYLGFNRSRNGGVSWDTAKSILQVNYRGGLSKGVNTITFFNFPSMDVDRSTGPRRGWAYIVYAEQNPTTPDIFLIRSTDRGSSWSNPIKVNQDNSGNDQWQPWMSVDPSTGSLFVVYYDSRKFTANDSAQVYVSASTDGGSTFSDILVSDASFLPRKLTVSPGTRFFAYMGSYIGISALNGVVWPCWMDNRTGIHQVYTSRITFP